MGGVEGAGEVYGTAGILNDEDFEGAACAVGGGVADAEVEGKAGDEDALDAAVADPIGESGGGLVVVFVEGGVGIDLAMDAFAEDERGVGNVEGGVELRAGRALNAVVGPERLWAIGGLDGVVGPAAGVLGGEGEVVGGVPILGEDDVLEAGGELVNGRDDGVAICDGECATGAEVELDIHEEEEIIGAKLHDGASGGRVHPNRSEGHAV